MKKWLCVLLAMALMASLSVVVAEDEDKTDEKADNGAEKRAKIEKKNTEKNFQDFDNGVINSEESGQLNVKHS